MTAINGELERVEKGWREFNAMLHEIGPAALTVTGPDGWAVKDHLVHIAAWEHSLIALFEGADRREAMGVTVDETDAINAQVWALHRDKTPEEALAYFHGAHELLVQLLSTMSDSDLRLSYNHYQPNDPRDASDDRPVQEWVGGNTYEHYAEHAGWIRQLVSESSAAR